MNALQGELPFEAESSLWLPFHRDLLAKPELSSANKVTLAYLSFRQGIRADFRIRTAELAETLGTAPRSMRDRMEDLEGRDLIEIYRLDERHDQEAFVGNISVKWRPDNVGWVRVPVQVLRHLTPTAVVVDAGLEVHTQKWSKTNCKPSQMRLSEVTGLEQRQIRRALRELEGVGRIESEQPRSFLGRGAANRYTIHPWGECRWPEMCGEKSPAERRKESAGDTQKRRKESGGCGEKSPAGRRKESVLKKIYEGDLGKETNYQEVDLRSDPPAGAVVSPGWGKNFPFLPIQEREPESDPGRETPEEIPPMTQRIRTNEVHFWNEEAGAVGESEEDDPDPEKVKALQAEAEARLVSVLQAAASRQSQRSNTRNQQADKKLTRIKQGISTVGDVSDGGDKKALQKALIQAATRIELTWKAETQRFSAQFPSWGTRNLARVGYDMINRFGVVGTERVFQYACRCWPLISKRMLRDTAPVPSLDFILRKADDLFSESSIWEQFDIVKKDWDQFWTQHPDAIDVPETLSQRKDALGTDYQRLGLKF